MDPVAHTLVGACMGEAGLKRWTRCAAATLIIGANLPDIDGVATALGPDAMYGLRRGWTHGVLAMVALPLALAAAMTAWDRWRGGEGEAASPKRLLALSFLSVWSHPALDWLNTYGVRLGMPFDGTWYYGDALFILDPWMWLSAGAAVVLARSRSRGSLLGWGALGLALSGPMFLVSGVPLASRAVWAAGLVAIGAARALQAPPSWRVARAALVVLIGYITSQIALTRWAEGAALEALSAAHGPPAEVFAQPLPARPFTRDVIAVYPERYRFGRVGLGEAFRETDAPILRGGGEHAELALSAEALQGFAHWLRFPAFTVETGPKTSVYVNIQDVRYSRRAGSGIGRARVWVDMGEVIGVELRPQ